MTLTRVVSFVLVFVPLTTIGGSRRVSALPPQCGQDLCLSDSESCDTECGVGSTIYTCAQFIALTVDGGLCNYPAWFAENDPSSPDDDSYGSEPSISDTSAWEAALADIDTYGYLDGSISGATAALDVMASYGLMPEGDYYIDWADGNDQGSSPSSYGMSPQSWGWTYPWWLPTCSQRQTKVDRLTKGIRGSMWAGSGWTIVAVLTTYVPPISGPSWLMASGFGLAAYEMAEQRDQLKQIPCMIE